MKQKDGYILDVTYPIFFYKEMQALWLSSTINFLGFKTPNITKSFSYLELACGTGINLIICAINNPNGHFIGVDFNKEHIDKAKNDANFIGLKNIEFIHSDFATFLEINHNKFDFIVNHGTFSWISPTNQKNILKIVSEFLNDLGILYLHYMCYPGSTPLLPIQKLLNLVDHHVNESSNKSIEIGKNLFNDLNNAGTFVDNPKINSIVKTLENSNSYLAHEFLTDYWNPLFSVDVHKMVFENAKATFLGSANVIENLDNISIPSKVQEIIKNTKAPDLKEYLKDLARNSKQRVDIFQKNPQIFSNKEHIEVINKLKFKLLPNAPKKGAVTFNTSIGDIEAPKEVISEMLEKLSKKEMSFEELSTLKSFINKPMFLIETIFLLMNANYLQVVSSNEKYVDKRFVDKFNDKMKKDGINLEIYPKCCTAI
ncbi:class I SAM-dependent methyltransferase [Aliarcobacter butzleri]|uniref:Class I SAM-dependent methyltransferase n=2 Tax=Aliarcobacter butzleri TaxID=28197 RepID=A0AAW6VJ80_9BACT|nr:class I SAM-dependent methyltransferase [Aliarcobacter butzleri]MDK2042247.1 class I SAM-dependent methyltransferase [Aliarcobacter butzleri]MDK2097329.1 class I SAM-dependent methyltransferase [Aliarcobacter butzleri]